MMNPSAKYCYVPFRKESYKRSIIKEFGRELIKELVNNPDGLQLPNPFGKVIIYGHVYYPRARVDISYKYDNSSTGGQIFEVYIQPKVVLFKKMRNYKMKELRTFKRKLTMYGFVRQAIFRMVKEDKWSNHNMYDGLFHLKRNI